MDHKFYHWDEVKASMIHIMCFGNSGLGGYILLAMGESNEVVSSHAWNYGQIEELNCIL